MKVDRILLGSLIATLVCFASSQIPSSDDFCNKIQVSSLGSLEYANRLYLSWTGRYITTLAVGHMFNLFNIEMFNLISVFNVFCFLGGTFVLAKTFGIKEKSFSVIWVFIICIVMLGMRDNVGQFIFWPTGGLVYIFPYFIFMLTIYFLRKEDTPLSILFILVLVTSSLLESITPALFVFMVPYLIGKKPMWSKVIIVTLFLLGSGILILAPGNFARATTSGGIIFNFFSVVSNFFFLLYKCLRYVWAPILVSFALGFFSVDRFLFDKKNKQQGILFFIAALLSLAPFVVAPKHFTGRSSSLFVLLLSIGVFIRSTYFFQNKSQIHKYQQFSYLLPACLIIWLIVDSVKMLDVRSHFLVRHKKLSEAPQKTDIVVVERISNLPKNAHFDDIKDVSDHWINFCVARYYGVQKVRVEVKSRSLE